MDNKYSVRYDCNPFYIIADIIETQADGRKMNIASVVKDLGKPACITAPYFYPGITLEQFRSACRVLDVLERVAAALDENPERDVSEYPYYDYQGEMK